MRTVEQHNPDLVGVLPKSYVSIEDTTIASLLRHINAYTKDLEGNAFGLIYGYFLAKFAPAEGQGAGAFFTPAAIVRLIVEIMEPFHGRIFDPTCGSAVHSAHFVERHKHSPGDEQSLYGQAKTGETVRAGDDEPRDPRPVGRDWLGQQLLRRPARKRWSMAYNASDRCTQPY
jgi:type I restriction enzyme M protein